MMQTTLEATGKTARCVNYRRGGLCEERQSDVTPDDCKMCKAATEMAKHPETLRRVKAWQS